MSLYELAIASLAIIAIFVVPFAAIAWILTSLIRTRNQERLELIKQGIEPTSKKSLPNKYATLRNGCLFVGLAVGLITGVIINLNCSFTEMTSFLVVCAPAILGIGIGYVTFYLLVKDKNMEEE